MLFGVVAISMHPLWREYCTKSTLHGLQYVVARGRPIFERIIWLVLIISGAIGIATQLMASWNQLNNGPIQVVVENPRYDLHNIDFPAITVCSFNKVNAVKAINLFERMFRNNSSEKTKNAFLNSLMALSLLRFPYYNHAANFIHDNKNLEFFEFRNEDIRPIMKEVNPTMEEMFTECFWRGSKYNCSDLFRPQLTEEGYCYSFNSRTAVMTKAQNITPPFVDKDGRWEVLRNNAAGKISAMELFMNFPKKEYRLKQDYFRPDGYSIMVHGANDYPDSARNIAVIKSSDKVYRISVSVSITRADSSLAHLSEHVRGCTYVENSHKKLSDSFCQFRCRKKYLQRHCNCLPYFTNHTNETRTCGIQDLECISLHNVNLRTSTVPEGIKGFPAWSMPLYMPCNCPQQCSYITYDTEVSITYPISATMNSAYPGYFAYIDVAYKHPWAITYNMQARFSFSDLIVAIGGVAGLLLGCSMFSVIELLYYLGRYIHEVFVIHRKIKLYPYTP